MSSRHSASRPSSFLLRFRRAPVVILQLLLVAVSNFAAVSLRFDGHPPAWALEAFAQTLPWLVLLRGVFLLPFRLYEGLWRYTSIYDLQSLLGSVVASSACFFLYIVSPWGPAAYPRSTIVTDAMLVLLLLGGIRMTRRIYSEVLMGSPNGHRRVLIYGAGSAGRMIAREMRVDASVGLRPVGFIDDDPKKVGTTIQGIRVLGSRRDLARVIGKRQPSEILIAMPGTDPAVMRDLVQALRAFKLPIRTLPRLRDIIDGRTSVGQIRDLSFEDLLPRAPVGLDQSSLQQLVHGRRIMVTGAGGSIGSELCRQILSLGPSRLVLFERYENSLHAIRLELGDVRSRTQIAAVIGDVGDRVVVDQTLTEYRPEIVFHAAAHKHVPLMEENPAEAIKNNVWGTRILAERSEAAGVDRFILISTDKAANPSSVMGASKRLAEMAVRLQAKGSGTSFAIVRFGNVLGSNGSVVPRFLEQIRRGGPVTVTHPDVRRYFMTIPEAVQLVLHAASVAVSGKTYVLEMGEQLRLVDVAENLIRLAGLVPGEDVHIEFIGMRPGEKMFEELHGHDEDLTPSPVPKVQIVVPAPKHVAVTREQLETLEELAFDGRTAEARERLFELAAAHPSPTVSEPAIVAVEPPAEPTAESAAPAIEELLPVCPSCHLPGLHRSRSRTMRERVQKVTSHRRLYRCAACGWRGWTEPKVTGIGALFEVDDRANLSELDLPSTTAKRRGGSFSPRDLE